MAAPNFLTQNFDSDEEDEDDDFNPAPAAGSDDEADADGDAKAISTPVSASAPRRAREDNEQSGTGKANGRGSAEPKTSNGRQRSEATVRDGDEEDELDGDGGEDDEGAGEDLDDDEDDDEDDEDDDDEEAVSGRPRKRRRRGGLNQFFEEEAEVDEDDDAEDDEDELGNDGFVADTHPDDLDQLPAGAETDDRRHRELDRRREIEASMDAEKQAQALKERYGRRGASTSMNNSFVPQNLLMPSVDDPSIWGVRCKQGKEREVVFNIMKKFEERLNTKQPMRICSAFERGNGPMNSYVFIEARKRADVDDALNGIVNVYPRTKVNLVPVREMPDLLRVTKTKELVRDGYVRIKRGLYQGDLAMIQDVESNGLEVTVRLVPRLTYGMDEDDKNSPMGAGNSKGDKRKRFGQPTNNYTATRPPQRLFSESEAKKRHSKYLTPARGLTGRSWNYKNEVYEDGFLIKDMKLQHLITQDVNPRLDEITKLTRIAADGTETLDLESLAHSLRDNKADGSYIPGDEVEVYDGEQKGIVGRTEAVSGNIVSIKVSEGELAGQIVDVPMKGLRKRFREGDHVKVIGGSRYRDELGMVIRIKDDRVTVLTDTSMQEITVFSKDLREATDSGGNTQLAKYDVHELVQLDPATVACVIKVDRESIRVLDQNGSIRSILPSQVTNKIEPRRNAVATDRNGSEIRHGDVVREVTGEGKTGVILHIHRSFLFIHNRTQLENSGLFTTRCVNVATVAAKGGRITGTGPDLTKMNPALQLKNGMNGNAMAPPKTFGRDRLLGKTVTVRKGPYKGTLGIVKDTTETQARVELHSKSKVITVEKELLSVKDPLTGQSMDFSRFGGGSRGPSGANRGGFGNSTPSRVPSEWQGSRTPMAGADGGRTPAWGATARTPAWAPNPGSGADTGRTPAWKQQSGSQTSYGGAGNTTSYGGPTYGTSSGGGTGSRTPAWSSSARTPYGQDHGFGSGPGTGGGGFDAFASGSRTPAYGASGSRTPAWGGGAAASAPTPGKPYEAPTPGRGHDDFPTPYGGAPTPAASAPTPRFADNAPTPRGWNEGNAPTPAAARGANPEPSSHSRFDAPTPGGPASAPTPAPYGSGYGIDAPTPAAGGGDGPKYIDSDEEE